MTFVDEFSLTAVPLEQYFNDTRLGYATGFMWEVAGAHYLVTNWHVLSARDFYTRKNLNSANAGRPNKLRAFFCISPNQWADRRQHSVANRNGGFRPRFPLRRRSSRLSSVEARKHSVGAGSRTTDDRLHARGHGLKARNVRSAGDQA
ncbi:hypothetical protein [Neorhizobium sp. P12A]|uniref:hypothetical protein n=1 Tax=Neorhizobium sp. P12A TaxID=2268027 RepID=UPI0011EF22D8|nr:hypothetical protein [Neorhizobium sp. P12A]